MSRRIQAISGQMAVGQQTARYLAKEPTHLRTREDLFGLRPPFKRLLAKELDSGALAEQICPVLFEDSSTGVFSVPDFAQDDQVYAMLDLLVRSRYRLHPSPIFVVAKMLLLSLQKTSHHVAVNNAQDTRIRSLDRSSLLKVFDEIVHWGFVREASDIHFNIEDDQAESSIRFSLEGRYLSPLEFRNFPTRFLFEMLSVAWMEIQGGSGAVFDPRVEQQGRLIRLLDGKRLSLRWASLATDRGPSVCLRLLRADQSVLTPDLVHLGYLPSQVETFQRQRHIEGGAIVIAGVVGSGKSTTIASLMRNIPGDRKIITLEDPAEYSIPNALQNTVTRSLDGDDVMAFDTKLKTIKRSAMHDLLIGEIRDQPSGRAFCDLAASGTNLYTSLHAGSSLLICDRLSSSLIGVPSDFLATPGILKLLVYQRLVPILCVQCALNLSDLLVDSKTSSVCGNSIERHACANLAGRLADVYGLQRDQFRFRNPEGCARCREQRDHQLWGFAGRTVVSEMIEPLKEPDFLVLLKKEDSLGLYRWFEQRSHSNWADADMSGKSVLACAIYKMAVGLIDPRDIEARFGFIFQHGQAR